jgi:hypothetical protein
MLFSCEIIQVNRFSTPIPCLLENYLYKGGEQTKREQWGFLQFNSLRLVLMTP